MYIKTHLIHTYYTITITWDYDPYDYYFPGSTYPPAFLKSYLEKLLLHYEKTILHTYSILLAAKTPLIFSRKA